MPAKMIIKSSDHPIPSIKQPQKHKTKGKEIERDPNMHISFFLYRNTNKRITIIIHSIKEKTQEKKVLLKI